MRDLVTGALGLVLAAVYYLAADALPVSLLSDAVGAAGVPKALAIGLGLLSAMLILRAVAARPTFRGTGSAADPWPHLQALGVVGLGAAYAALAPYLGYPVAVAALIGVTALYFGMRPSPRLVLVALAGAALFWGLFVKILGVAMPEGLWPRLIG